MVLIFLYDRHMTSKTFTKQNLAVLCNHNALYKNVQVFFECYTAHKGTAGKAFAAHMPVFIFNVLHYLD
jgi:hypothetical protein